jgi:hypothetical protein
MGLSIDASHCAVTNDGSGGLTLINMSQHTCVSGDSLHPSDQHALQDGDWVVFGKSFDGHVLVSFGCFPFFFLYVPCHFLISSHLFS